MKPLSILAFVPSLGGGGAEKHVERIANAVDRREATIEVATVRAGGSFERFLDPTVRRFALRPFRLGSGTGELVASLPALRRVISEGRYDAIIGFLERPALASLFVSATLPASSRPAVLISVQADPASIVRQDPLGPLFELAMRRVYRRADAVIAISAGVASALRAFDPTLEPIVVPNACVDARLREAIGRPVGRSSAPTIVACGRLTEQKGFDVLLEAFAHVRREIPDATLRIVGTGPLEKALREQAARLGLASAVTFVGFVDEPVRELAAADVFCLSSRFEGLGMVLVEAMAAGTPVVSTDCPYGPNEILAGGEYGALVPVGDPRALGTALVQMLSDPDRRRAYSAKGSVRAEDYDAGRIAREYVEAARAAIARQRSRLSSSKSAS